jgi:hypothetical protein
VEVRWHQSMRNNRYNQSSDTSKDHHLKIANLSYCGEFSGKTSPRPPLESSPFANPDTTISGFEMIEQIIDRGQMIAVIISRKFNLPGAHFFTPGELSQQLGYMRYPIGKIIHPHIHKPIVREIHYTQEVLVIKRGKLRVDFYNNQQEYIKSRILGAGDVILLASGGHGFEVLEEIEMIEVKQGPYIENQDRISFVGVCAAQTNINI